MHSRLVALAAACTLLCATVAAAQSSPTFSTTPYPNNLWASSYGLNGHIAADLNGDGLTDFVSAVTPSFNAECTGSFALTLSRGDGTYNAPMCFDLPSGNAVAFAAADFNRSGWMSLVVATDDDHIYWFQNTGVGNLQYRNSINVPPGGTGLVAADFNRDGNADLAYVVPDPSGNNANQLYVWFGNDDGTFRTGPVTNFVLERAGAAQFGDFDWDNQTDIAVQGRYGTLVLYGDGTGNFTPGALVGGSPIAYRAVDISGNGASDLIGTPLATTEGRGPTTYFKHLLVEYGRTNRVFNEQYVWLKSCTPDATPPESADVNGDGLNDIIVIEAADCSGAYPWTVNVMLNQGNGTWGSEQPIYTYDGRIDESHIVRANLDTKPDLVFYTTDELGGNPQEIIAFNTSTGNFPACNPPLFGFGITACAPTSTTGANSPVTFSFGATNNSLGRDLEVWVDGNKVADQLRNAFANFTFADVTTPLSAGQHWVDVYSKSWDFEFAHTSFPLTVGSDVCPKTGAALNVCSPIRSSTLTSPVMAYARAHFDPSSIVRMEIWVDGVKRYTSFASDTLQTQISLGSGIHTFTYYVVTADGAKYSQEEQAYVK